MEKIYTSQIFITLITENLTTFFLKSLFINIGLLGLCGQKCVKEEKLEETFISNYGNQSFPRIVASLIEFADSTSQRTEATT